MFNRMHFEELVKKISPKLKGIVYKLSYAYRYFTKDDLYQEAMAHLWSSFSCGKLGDKTDSYVLQGCYFYLKNYIRCHNPRARLVSWESFYTLDDDSNMARALIFPDPASEDFQEKLNNKLLADTIRNNGLTKREKRIIAYYAQGLTTRGIGRRLGVSHVRVVRMTATIREKCRKYLDKI